MKFTSILPEKSISHFVKDILVYEDIDCNKTVLPFFADGFPGIMVQETETGLLIHPHNKIMPPLFLYGQTLHPITLEISGKYKLIIFRLYPFVIKSLFNREPKQLNDNCFNLELLGENSISEIIITLNSTSCIEKKIESVTLLLHDIISKHKKEFDYVISKAIQRIIDKRGNVSIASLRKEFHLTERTFERRFLHAAGVTAKQFAKIIQFQHSYEELKSKKYSKLSDIVYSNGYTDQSHFIKVFKSYTGKTPRTLLLEV